MAGDNRRVLHGTGGNHVTSPLRRALVCTSQAFATVPVAHDPKPLNRLAFGSCNHHLLSQKYWPNIVQQSADAWLWLGDIVYSDGASAKKRARDFARVKRAPGYQTLIASTTVLGTWDDHEYGPNNSNQSWRDKIASQRVLLDFLDEPADSPRRAQEGIYAAYRFGPSERLVKLLVLDQRYFRQEEGPDADILGETQWRWLERELARDDAELTIFASSTQVVAQGPLGEESWGRYPKARERLYDLLRKTQGRHLILSGDRHFSELSVIDLTPTRRLIDFTSSGLTHSLFARRGQNRT
jgi:alkaline phosphatase D